MAWFKVDDGLHDHRKTRQVRRSHPEKRRDVAPFGLWVLAGSWAGGNGTGGFVPTEVIEEWDDDALQLAERLVAAGLWWPTEQDGEDGYGFHDWDERNPVEEVESGKFGNHLRWHVNRGIAKPECQFCHPESPRSSPPNRGDRSERSGTTSPPDSSPDPTRPDQLHRATADADRTTQTRFDEFWTAYDKKVGRKKAEQKYQLVVRKGRATEDQLIAAASAYIDRQRDNGKHPEFTKNPLTWLNGEHWNDETPSIETPSSWRAPLALPKCPPDIADDPEQYAMWTEAWWAGDPVPIEGGGFATREAS